jgi:hypothetical protein
VDALLGERTRPHKDLDVAVWLTDLPRIERQLASFRRVGDDESPGFMLLRDPRGRTLELLLVRDELEGNYRQQLASGRLVDYPRDETCARATSEAAPSDAPRLRCRFVSVSDREQTKRTVLTWLRCGTTFRRSADEHRQ